MTENLLMAPHLSGIMYQSTEYTNMGVGLTDPIVIIGHADGLPLNTPTEVLDLRAIINLLGADDSCPLLRGLLEAYYCGARDIWIVAAAPMSEYQNLDYNTYADRLVDTYELLKDFDIPQIVVPLDAPAFGAGNVDFLTPLVNFCTESFAITGSIKMGFIGTALDTINDVVIDEMIADPRLDSLNNDGKFVTVMVGSGLVTMTEIPTSYSSSPIASMAGVLSNQEWSRGLTYSKVPNFVTLDLPDLSKEQVSKLVEAKLNPLVKTLRGKRGRLNEVVLASDNTLGKDGSDFWSLGQVRLVANCVKDIKRIGNVHLGTVGFGQFKLNVQTYMLSLVSRGMIRDFTLSIEKSTPEPTSHTVGADVAVSVKPYFGIREIFFTAKVGPGA